MHATSSKMKIYVQLAIQGVIEGIFTLRVGITISFLQGKTKVVYFIGGKNLFMDANLMF
jgi:hypothetical protein